MPPNKKTLSWTASKEYLDILKLNVNPIIDWQSAGIVLTRLLLEMTVAPSMIGHHNQTFQFGHCSTFDQQ